MADIIPFNPDQTRALAQPGASDIVRSCPFCGERENLFCGEEEKHLGLDEDGKPIIEVIPQVFCDVCDASAPLDTWNGRRVPPHGAA